MLVPTAVTSSDIVSHKTHEQFFYPAQKVGMTGLARTVHNVPFLLSPNELVRLGNTWVRAVILTSASFQQIITSLTINAMMPLTHLNFLNLRAINQIKWLLSRSF